MWSRGRAWNIKGDYYEESQGERKGEDAIDGIEAETSKEVGNNGSTDKEVGWIWKRLKGLVPRQNGIKPVKPTWRQKIRVSQCGSKVIAKQAEESARNYEKGSEEKEDDSEGLGAEEGQQPVGRHGVDSRGPCHRKQDRKGRVGTHLCGSSQPCETDAPRGHLSEQGLLGTGARAALQEAGTETVVGGKKRQGNQRVNMVDAGRMILVEVENGRI